ncbi:MAG: 1-acyl-sn-glycerol-3-phosphate acyltransferase [Acidobacteria bacterium]|nr:1-acyl-sn-glycerol-3-phosphate acyltransferase [Acidobacteriota bacterium]
MRAFYWSVKGLAWPVLRAYLGFRVEGASKIPAAGACIVVANHASYLDAICLGSACPRRLRFLISHDIYSLLRLRWFYSLMEAIPLKIDAADTRALRTALDVLRSGGVVGIFPEGQRMKDGELGEGKLGVGFLASRSGAPVIPGAIVGAQEAMPVGAAFPRPRRVRVVFGEPIPFRPRGERAKKEELIEFSNSVMATIARLGAAGDVT